MQTGNSNGLRCLDLSIEVPGRMLVNALRMEVEAGEFVAVLGPNGVGKSLALHALAGIRAMQGGHIELDGSDIGSLPRQQVALRLALLPQYTEDFFPATVFDTVMIGRHPHIRRLQWETMEDRQIALEALRAVDLDDFTNRDVLTLSGGERQRLAIAQILTQAPGIFLLDEPTNHLDPQHQLDVLRIFRDKANAGDIVLASLHDANLASRFADRCLLLFGDGRWIIGNAQDVLVSEQLSALYSIPVETVPWRAGNLFVAV